MPSGTFASRARNTRENTRLAEETLGVEGYVWDRQDLISGPPRRIGSIVADPTSSNVLTDIQKRFLSRKDAPLYLVIADCNDNSSTYARFIKQGTNPRRVQIGQRELMRMRVPSESLRRTWKNSPGASLSQGLKLPDISIDTENADPMFRRYAGQTFTGTVVNRTPDPSYPSTNVQLSSSDVSKYTVGQQVVGLGGGAVSGVVVGVVSNNGSGRGAGVITVAKDNSNTSDLVDARIEAQVYPFSKNDPRHRAQFV